MSDRFGKIKNTVKQQLDFDKDGDVDKDDFATKNGKIILFAIAAVLVAIILVSIFKGVA